jgi:hypothetical protein
MAQRTPSPLLKSAAKAVVPLSPVLFLVASAHFFNDIYMGFLTPLYPIAMDKFGLTLSRWEPFRWSPRSPPP